MEKKLRIAFFVYSFPNLSETFILNRATGLIDRGHTVDLYSLAGPPAPSTTVHPDVNSYKLMERTRHAPPLPAKLSDKVVGALKLLPGALMKNPRLVRTLNPLEFRGVEASFRLLFSATPLLPSHSYDIIHCFFGPIGSIGMQLREIGITKGKLVVSFLGFDLSGYLRDRGEKAYSELFRKGDLFLPNCNYFKQRLIHLGCPTEKIKVHRCGIDCAAFPYSERRIPKEGRVNIVTVGRLAEKKGLEYAIRAVAAVSHGGSSVLYSIIGDGPLRSELEQLITALRMNNVVKLLGPMHQLEVASQLAAAHIFVAPSITGDDGNQEGIPNVLKEAMAMGLPVISTWHSGIPELVEDGVSGYLVPERNIAALADRINHLANNPQLWRSMGIAGRTRVENMYDINAINDQLVGMYRSLLSSGKAGDDPGLLAHQVVNRNCWHPRNLFH